MVGRKHMAGWGGSSCAWMTVVLLCLWLSGLVMYGWQADALADLSPGEALLRRASVTVHGVAAWLFCVLCGRGVWPHVRVMWQRQAPAGRWFGGLASLLWLAWLAPGGLVLLYGSPWLHDAMAPWHFWAGALGPAVFVAHTWRRWLPASRPQ